ncbi:hypothetical protein FEM48_Zijuj11G0014400 [Ziziphus jujuba var. spinosa]|uniref:Uncharacterized protein n=1 Tax=Ziziphus jujuba var. spinosa TaxID=714518 RepID=A0A978U8V1_ZIZJJ|nr:hypothetical protein FEM48_ZijujUnG0073100 [Ziziphus jujuba var. spinosa]KAH7513749.1 hypothetical protein FEM48_Zijuj11G0014400 [Ziziphus jujuba var. spinosa]
MHGNMETESENRGNEKEAESARTIRKERGKLEWLMLQLKNKGGKSSEDVLEKIERSREKAEGWKPSLESIMECPEVVEMDRPS